MGQPEKPGYVPYSELPSPTEAQLAEGVLLHNDGRHIEMDDGKVVEVKVGTGPNSDAVFRIAKFRHGTLLATTGEEGNRAELEEWIPSSHELVVGRAVDLPGAELPSTVSRFQFGVRKVSGGVNILDLDSRNGTFVRDVPPEERA